MKAAAWRACILALTLALAAPAGLSGQALPTWIDVDKEPDGSLFLTFEGPGPQFDLYRDPDPQQIGRPGTFIGTMFEPFWIDSLPPEVPLLCYSADSVCEQSSAEVCNYLDDNCDGQIDEGFDLLNDPANCGVDE